MICRYKDQKKLYTRIPILKIHEHASAFALLVIGYKNSQ